MKIGETLATRVDGYELMPSENIDQGDFSFLSQFIKENEYSSVSLEYLEKISKEVPNADKLQSRDKDASSGVPKDDKLHVEDEQEKNPEMTEEEQQEENKKVLDNMKQIGETPLNQKIDDRHTLGDVLGIKDSGASLVVVHSTYIDNNKNTTRYTFLIKDSKGNLYPADMLEQTRGIHSDINAYDAKLDNYPDIEKEQFTSSYAVTQNGTDENNNYVLLVKLGQYGYPEISLGKEDRTQKGEVVSEQLKNGHQGSDRSEIPIETRMMTRPGTGRDKVTKIVDEAQECEENSHSHGGNVEAADGDGNTISPQCALEANNVDKYTQEMCKSLPENARDYVLPAYLETVRRYANNNVLSLNMDSILEEANENAIQMAENDKGEHKKSDSEYEYDDGAPIHKH